MREDLLRWQFDGYPTFHKDRGNLLIHLVAVPMFGVCALSVLASLVLLQPVGVLSGLLGMAVAFGAQAIGHRREAEPPIPFDGPGDALSRIAAEQSITFYRYVLSGGWLAALRGS